MVSDDLLSMIRCPCSGESLRAADESLINILLQEKELGRLFNQLGVQVESEFDEGLVNLSATCFIMVREGIPELSPDQVIPIDHLEFSGPT